MGAGTGFSGMVRTGLRPAAALAGLVLSFAATAAAAEGDESWPALREMLFDDRPVLDGAGVVALEAPYRAHDAAVVPITVRAEMPQSAERWVKTIFLIIDDNPVPLAATFRLTPRSGSATVATRVRIDSYTNVRAVAETNDGALYMAARYVKASGGCSAPASKDADRAMARLGRMKLKQSTPIRFGEPNEVRLLIGHPNYSGLQMDQLTRHYVPAHFVSDIVVSYAGERVMSIEGAISISEDPSFRFSFVPLEPGEIAVEVRDTDDAVFTGSWPVAPQAGT